MTHSENYHHGARMSADMSAPALRASSQQPQASERSRRRRSSAHSASSSSMRLLDRCEFSYAVAESSISEWLKCPICLCPFVEPVRSPVCEHVFCKACLEQHLHAGRKLDDDGERSGQDIGNSSSSASSTNNIITRSSAARGQCPTCRALFHATDVRPAAALIRNMVDALLVKCPHAVRGCTHTCERGLVEGHARRDCGWMYVGEYDSDKRGPRETKGAEKDAAAATEPHRKLSQQRTDRQRSVTDLQRGSASPGRCECGSKVLRKDWKTHITSGECAVTRVACPFADGAHGCGAWVKECDLDEHKADCPARPTQCAHCHASIRQGDMAAHDDVCDEADVCCPMVRFGCAWHGRRGDLGTETGATHDRPSSHLSQCVLWPLRSFLQQNELHTSNLERENGRLAGRVRALEQEQFSVRSLLDTCVRALGHSFVVPPPPPPMAETMPSRATSVDVMAAPLSSSQDRDDSSAQPLAFRGRSGSSLAVSSSSSSYGQAPFSLSPLNSVSLPYASAPATANLSSVVPVAGDTEFPWQWPEAELGGVEPPSRIAAPAWDMQHRHRAASPAAVTVSESMEQVHAALASMVERMTTIERRLDDVHGVSLNASFEASRAHEELNSVRHGMHSVRLQMHSLLMQQQMERATLPGHMFPQGHSASGGGGTAPPAIRTPNEQQQPIGANPIGPAPPAMMGLRRFWNGFEQTKL